MNIFIGFTTFSEDFIYYEGNIIYEFFAKNNYNLIGNASNADYIILLGVPFNHFERVKALLSINYYLKKYTNKKIIIAGHLKDLLFGKKINKFGNLILIGLKNFFLFDKIFKNKISIFNVSNIKYRYFIPLTIEDLDLHNFGYKIYKKSNYKFKDKDFLIKINDLLTNKYDIYGIDEYDEKYNYIEDITDNLYLQTSLGCTSKCSYCIINKVGFIKSSPIKEIISLIVKGLKEGKKNIYLMDQDTGSYGLDIGLQISDLINAINSINMDFSVKIHYFEPSKLNNFLKYTNNSFFTKRLKEINIPLVLGTNKLLKIANRPYNLDEIILLIKKLKQFNPNIKINTEFIYGFPGESFDDFIDTFKYIKYFDNITYMLYSEHMGTKISNLGLEKNSIELLYKKYFLLNKVKKKCLGKIDLVYDYNYKYIKYLY